MGSSVSNSKEAGALLVDGSSLHWPEGAKNVGERERKDRRGRAGLGGRIQLRRGGWAVRSAASSACRRKGEKVPGGQKAPPKRGALESSVWRSGRET